MYHGSPSPDQPLAIHNASKLPTTAIKSSKSSASSHSSSTLPSQLVDPPSTDQEPLKMSAKNEQQRLLEANELPPPYTPMNLTYQQVPESYLPARITFTPSNPTVQDDTSLLPQDERVPERTICILVVVCVSITILLAAFFGLPYIECNS
jgi:hypothetical protein